MKKLYISKDEQKFLEKITYLYEYKNNFAIKGITYPEKFKKYKSFLKPTQPLGKYIHNYNDFGKTLSSHGIRKINQLENITKFDEVEPKIEFCLYKKISLSEFNKIDLSSTTYLKELSEEQFKLLPQQITDINQLINYKVHELYLETNFKKNHPYRNIKFSYVWKNFRTSKIGHGAIYSMDERKEYALDVKKNEDAYEKYLKNYSSHKDLFEKNISDNIQLNKIIEDYSKGSDEGIFDYLKLILNQCIFNKKAIPKKINFRYEREEKRLLIELQLADFDSFRIKEYLIKKDRTIQKNKQGQLLDKSLSETAHKKIAEYSLYLIPIRIIYEFFYFDTNRFFTHIALNGIISSHNKATGKVEKNNVLSLFVERKTVLDLKLNKVNPKECFRVLKGISSSKIYENIAINPILKFKKDRRMIDSKQILDNVKEENLAVMPWDDFEHLIRELFAKEFSKDGEEVKITQSSRDRGVDAIAYDPDPIRGGKYIIQAKRYTATVDVAAVRDLYGTIHNEGANRGILVTTANYGSDSHMFAKDKNISLINGNELLGLLNKHNYNNFKINIAEARKALNLAPKKSY